MSELEFDPPERELEFDGPQSGGAFAHKELPPEQIVQGERRRRLMNLLEARGEPGYGERLKDAFGMGLTRPISGAMAVIGDKLTGKDISAGDSWRAGVGAEEDYMARANKNTNPYVGAAVDLVGGIASGGPASSLARGGATVAQQAPTRAAQIGKALMGSTGSGAIEGAARNSEDVGSAAIGGAVGGTIGKAAGLIGEPVKKGASAIVDALQDRMSSRAAKEAVSEADRMGGSEALRGASSAIFDRLDNAGISFSGRETTTLANNVNAVTAGPLPASVRGEINEVVQDINRRVQNGAMTFGDVRAVQTEISKLKANSNPDVRRVAGDMSNAVDDFFQTARPTMPASSVGTVGPNDLAEARDLWRRGSLAGKAEYLAEKGSLVTPDTANKVRTNFSGEVDKVRDPDRFSRFQNNPGYVRQMEEIAAGDPAKAKTAKELNRWSNNLLGYGTIGSAGGLAALGTLNDPYGISGTASSAGLLAMAAGLAGKKGSGAIRDMVADRGAERVNTLIRNIVTGSAAQPAVKNVPREALARVLAEEQLKRGVGRYSSSFYDKE